MAAPSPKVRCVGCWRVHPTSSRSPAHKPSNKPATMPEPCNTGRSLPTNWPRFAASCPGHRRSPTCPVAIDRSGLAEGSFVGVGLFEDRDDRHGVAAAEPVIGGEPFDDLPSLRAGSVEAFLG